MKKSTTVIFTCEYCNSDFLKERSCKAHEPKCKKKTEATAKKEAALSKIRNYIRLNCDDVHSLRDMILDHINKYFPNTGLVFTTFDVRGFTEGSDSYRKNYITIRVDGSWKKPPQRKGNRGDASFTDLFGQWHDVDEAIAGIDTGSGGGGGNNHFGYDLYVLVDQFPKLKAKLETLKSLRSKKAAYDKEQQRLKNVHMDFVKNLCRIDPDRIVLNKEFDEVNAQLVELNKRHSQLQRDLDLNLQAISHKAWEENLDTFTPGEEFQYDSSAYHDCANSLSTT